MRQEPNIVFSGLVMLLATIIAIVGCAGEPSTLTGLHCELWTEDDGTRMYWLTETGDLDLILSVKVEAAGPVEAVFGLFVDGRQWPATWDGRETIAFATTLEPNSSREIPFCIRGLPRGVHALYLLTAILGRCDKALTEDQILNTFIAMNPFTVESRSSIEASPDRVALLTQGPATEVLQAGQHGILCVDPDTLGVDPSFDIRDRQTLFYVWRNGIDKPVEARFVLLVDWIETPWPNHETPALEVMAEANGVVTEPIDLSDLPISNASCVTVLVFLQPLRPFWLVDDSLHAYADPDGGEAFTSNYVLVLGR